MSWSGIDTSPEKAAGDADSGLARERTIWSYSVVQV